MANIGLVIIMVDPKISSLVVIMLNFGVAGATQMYQQPVCNQLGWVNALKLLGVHIPSYWIYWQSHLYENRTSLAIEIYHPEHGR